MNNFEIDNSQEIFPLKVEVDLLRLSIIKFHSPREVISESQTVNYSQSLCPSMVYVTMDSSMMIARGVFLSFFPHHRCNHFKSLL